MLIVQLLSFINIRIVIAKNSLKVLTSWGVCAFVCIVLRWLTAKASIYLTQTHAETWYGLTTIRYSFYPEDTAGRGLSEQKNH